jgi:NADPH:quinone reductase-like Zn-dependent oxidoreductase
MRAARIHSFGGPETIVIEDVPRPIPTTGELLVRVVAAGVGPWDALIREGKSKVSAQPPLTLGADLSGVVEELEPALLASTEVLRSTVLPTLQFYGANAEYPWPRRT